MRSLKVTHGNSPAYALDGAATARTCMDGAGVLVDWNEGASRLLGWSATDVVGRPAEELLAPGASFAPLPPGTPIGSGIVTLRHRDGRTVAAWLLAHHQRPKDGDGDGGWLILCPLDDPGPLVRDDPLAAALAGAVVLSVRALVRRTTTRTALRGHRSGVAPEPLPVRARRHPVALAEHPAEVEGAAEPGGRGHALHRQFGGLQQPVGVGRWT